MKTAEDIVIESRVKPPTEPGFYRYSGGRQTLIFLLVHHSMLGARWYVISDNGTMSSCVWGYIEQCLGVWDLVPIAADSDPNDRLPYVDVSLLKGVHIDTANLSRIYLEETS